MTNEDLCEEKYLSDRLDIFYYVPTRSHHVLSLTYPIGYSWVRGFKKCMNFKEIQTNIDLGNSSFYIRFFFGKIFTQLLMIII